MKNKFKINLKILGILFILVGIPLTTFLLKDQTAFKSLASDSEAPRNIKITNISDNSFTITYQTNELTTGSLSYGHNKDLGESELEDIDKERGSFSAKKTHSISVENLAPDTKYYLAIVSGSNIFLDDNAPFEVTTGPEIASPSAQESIIKGKIILPNGSPPSEALIYLNIDGSQLLSATATTDGTFTFPLKNLRTNDLSEYFNINDDSILKITATDGSLESSASASLTKTNTIPTITLSSNYNFAKEEPSISSKSAMLSQGFPSITPSNNDAKPEILTPKENQTVTDQKPKFTGTSLPNETVEITIHSDTALTTQVTADNNGNWTYNPPSNLSPGVHTITIKTRDASGILRTVEQSFTVYAADSQASESITPTTTPIQTITSTPTSTPILDNNVIVIPTVTQTPTPVPTITSSLIGSKGGLPPTGSLSAYLATAIGVATTVISLCLFIFIR